MNRTDVSCVINPSDQLGETPLWCSRTGRLWWLDIERPRVQSFDPVSREHRVFTFDAKWAGGLAFTAHGGLLVALDNALHVFDPETGTLTRFVDVEPPDTGTRLNDGRCDRRGRLWIGTADEKISAPLGSFYRVDPSGTVTRLFGDVIITNSVATSPDDRVLYVSDTRQYAIWAFDLDPDDGVLSNRRVFADFRGGRGRPDGSCVDADGCVWNAAFAGGCVIRFTPAGKIDRVIDLPVTNPTCVCFGGSGLDTLYITSATKLIAPDILARQPLAGAVLAVHPGATGLPEPQFGAVPANRS
jgi:sugar lactone lactonase YvrE